MGDDESFDDDSDAALVARFLSGDPAAERTVSTRLRRVFRAHARVVLRHWRGGRMGPSDEEDLESALVITLLEDAGRRALLQWDFTKTSLETFGRVWARSRLKEMERKEIRRLRLLEALGLDEGGEAEAADRPDQIAELMSMVAAILACVFARHTTELARRMVQGILVEGLDNDEVVEGTGMTRQAVFRWRSRILESARDCLERLLGLGS